MRKVSPSQVARTLAGQLWPDVQHQRMVAKGVYQFSCAGHGGLIAVVGVADLPSRAVEVARARNLIELVATRNGRTLTSERYQKDSLREWAATTGAEMWECWVGEEDCDWATIALVSPDVQAGLSCTSEEALRCCESWNERFLLALDPSRTPIPGGQVDREDRRARILDEGGVLLSAAYGDWAEDVPEGWVKVLFRGKDREHEEWYLMPKDVYQARSSFQFPLDATPEQFKEVGQVEKIANPTEPSEVEVSS